MGERQDVHLGFFCFCFFFCDVRKLLNLENLENMFVRYESK